MRASKIILTPFLGKLDNYAHFITCMAGVALLTASGVSWFWPEIVVLTIATAKEALFDQDQEWSDYIYNLLGTVAYRPAVYVLTLIISAI